MARNFRGHLETGGLADSQQKTETLSNAATRNQILQTTTQEEKQVLPLFNIQRHSINVTSLGGHNK